MHVQIFGRNTRAGGSECIIFGHVDAKSWAFTPVVAAGPTSGAPGFSSPGFSAHGDWRMREMRPGAGLPVAPALVSVKPDGVYCRTTGALALLSHRWSGVLAVNDVGRRYVVDLYSEETRLVLMDIRNEALVDITGLARTKDGALALPALTADALVDHICQRENGFQLLDRDETYDAGIARRALERLRAPPSDRLRRRLLARLLPLVAAHRSPMPAPVSAPTSAPAAPEDRRLRDEVRLLSAAVEGLALRSVAS